MACEARHFGIAVRAILLLDTKTKLVIAGLTAEAAHQLGARGLGIEDRLNRIDAILDQADFPFERRIDN